MRVYNISAEREKKPGVVHPASIGGHPFLAPEEKWPSCKLCRQRMIFFFQLTIEKRFDLPLKSGSQLAVFMCPTHNDTPSDSPDEHGVMPPEYWNMTFGHYYMTLNHPRRQPRGLTEAESVIQHQRLLFTEQEEDIAWDGEIERGSRGFKVGGVPSWQGRPEFHHCNCGAEMVFICQVPAEYPFPKTEKAPRQPDNHNSTAYYLFLGHETYIFACKDMCSSHSLWAVAQAPRLAELVL